MKHSKFNRFLCVALSAIMSLGVTSCGKSDDTVDDYGSGSSDVASTNDVGTSSDADIASGAEGTLRDQFGKRISWDEEFTVDNVRFTADLDFDVPEDSQGMNVYNATSISDSEENEAALVKSLFGDTAEKIEELKYVNETDYISMLYKYRQIIQNHEQYEKNVDTEGEYIWVEPDYSVINGAFEETYKWLDDNDIHIHMYEGQIDGKRFGLIYAYDYIGNTKTIFVEPISIKEYFPEADYKSLMVKSANNYLGQPMEVENNCTDNPDDLIGEARGFVQDNLKIAGNVDISQESRLYTLLCTNDLTMASSGSYIFGTYGMYNSGYSVLEFSDTDYISSLRADNDTGTTVDYRILTEQRDVLKEYTEAHPDKDTDVYDLIMDSSTSYNEFIDEPNITVDGYAVFLGSGVYSGGTLDMSSGLSVYSPNAGIIMYTSKGFYGADIRISEEITDVVEDVNLLGFDKIKESVEAGLGEKFDKDKLDVNAKGVYISQMYLTYTPDSDNPDGDKFSYIPTWVFLLEPDDHSIGAMISINAMDGSVVDLYYFGG